MATDIFDGLDFDASGTSAETRYPTVSEYNDGSYKGRLPVVVNRACLDRDKRDKRYLKVEFKGGTEANPWLYTARYFNLKQSRPFQLAIDVLQIKGKDSTTINKQLVGKKLDIEFGVRQGNDGNEYLQIKSHHAKLVSVANQ